MKCWNLLYQAIYVRLTEDRTSLSVLGFLEQKAFFLKKLNNQTTFSLIKDTLIFALLIITVVHAERIHFLIGISSCLYLPLSLSEAA